MWADANGGRRLNGTRGLIYFNARYYDPITGRFLTEDPSRKGVNWYAYCENNPVNRVDPTGKQSNWSFGIKEGLESMIRIDFGREEFGYAYNAPNPLMAAGWTLAGTAKMALDIGKAYAVAAALPLAIGIGAALFKGDVQSFFKGLTSSSGFHAGLETSENVNLVHFGVVPQGSRLATALPMGSEGYHLAVGGIGPYVADVHAYLENAAVPSLRFWAPNSPLANLSLPLNTLPAVTDPAKK